MVCRSTKGRIPTLIWIQKTKMPALFGQNSSGGARQCDGTRLHWDSKHAVVEDQRSAIPQTQDGKPSQLSIGLERQFFITTA